MYIATEKMTIASLKKDNGEDVLDKHMVRSVARCFSVNKEVTQ